MYTVAVHLHDPEKNLYFGRAFEMLIVPQVGDTLMLEMGAGEMVQLEVEKRLFMPTETQDVVVGVTYVVNIETLAGWTKR